MVTTIFLWLILSKVVSYVRDFQLHIQNLNAFYGSRLHSYNCGLPGGLLKNNTSRAFMFLA